jgi:hypothetical protein
MESIPIGFGRKIGIALFLIVVVASIIGIIYFHLG